MLTQVLKKRKVFKVKNNSRSLMRTCTISFLLYFLKVQLKWPNKSIYERRKSSYIILTILLIQKGKENFTCLAIKHATLIFLILVKKSLMSVIYHSSNLINTHCRIKYLHCSNLSLPMNLLKGCHRNQMESIV